MFAPRSRSPGAVEVTVRIATLISWVLTASIGARMLRSTIIGGGLRRQRASSDGVFPGLLFSTSAWP